MYRGIDVSTWQGKIDWNAVKQDGIEFAIIRTGYGRGGENQIDNMFYDNIKGAKSAGLDVGVYHYSYAESPEDARTEAKFCLSILNGESLDLPVYFDIEDQSIAIKHDRDTRTQMCINFCTEIENVGYWAGVYANLNWFNNYLNKDELAKRYTLWLAQYNETQDMSADIWQYTSSGKVNGINGNVDMNIMHRDLPSEIRGRASNVTHEEQRDSNRSVSYYRIQSGDTLSGIAAKFGTTYQYLAQINGIDDPNLIYKGEVLIVPSGPNAKISSTYIVKSGDSLWSIAQSQLGDGSRYHEIKSLNGLSNDTIYPGQILKLPC